jgi:phytoene dehydrogenase-like protein
VRLASAADLRAPIGNRAGGARTTYERFVPRELAAPMLETVRAIGPSTAHVSLYLGLSASDAELGLDGTNLWVFAPGDREEAFRRFSADPNAPIPIAYVSFPSAKDPSFASRHPGKATALVVTPARIEWLERWAETAWMKRDALYDEWKARTEARLMAIVLEHRPQLRGRIAHAELSTPLTTRHFTGHAHGEIYGLAHTPARFRLGLRPRTAIEGLFLAGVDVSSCGVGGAMLGGLLCAAAVLEAREGRRSASMTRLAWLRRMLS